MLFKDASNSKSNQQNLGTIKCSNLCTEIVQYSDKEEVAVCNLASIVLPKFVSSLDNQDKGQGVEAEGNESPPAVGTLEEASEEGRDVFRDAEGNRYRFDMDRLHAIAKIITVNLNKVIDSNHYPLPQARNSNLKHRLIGIGVQGLADVFQMMCLPFDSPEARRLNKNIFETVYFAALEASNELAMSHGPYASYHGSPVSRGILQHDMWGERGSSRWDWAGLRARIKQYGVRNSLLVAPMPTASTAQIMGNNECFEPYTRWVLTFAGGGYGLWR